MPIDPYAISTGLLALTTGGTFIWGMCQKARAELAEEELSEVCADRDALAKLGKSLRKQVDAFEAKEAKRRRDAKRASLAGHAVQSAKAKERHDAAASKTLNALVSAPPPPREEVVAGVMARRAAKKSGGRSGS